MKSRSVQVKIQCVMVSDFDIAGYDPTESRPQSIGEHVDDMVKHYSGCGWKPNKIVVDLCPPTTQPEDLTQE